VPRIGFLFAGLADDRTAARRDAFVAGLHDYGYSEAQTIQIEWRYLGSQSDAAGELAGLQLDAIVSSGDPATHAVQQATGTIPVAFVAVSDPVGAGYVRSLARPGGNISGVSAFSAPLMGKRLEILNQLESDLARVAYVYNLNNASNVIAWNELRQAADTRNIVAMPIALQTGRTADDLVQALTEQLERAVSDGIQAVICAGVTVFSTDGGVLSTTEVNAQVSDLAVTHGLASLGFERSFPEAGGLMCYGADALAIVRRGAYYVDRILKGEKPADIPVEQPTVFELVVNVKTLQTLGLTLPPAIVPTDWIQ
jgi:putative ABC transport system substrate-binding protein